MNDNLSLRKSIEDYLLAKGYAVKEAVVDEVLCLTADLAIGAHQARLYVFCVTGKDFIVRLDFGKVEGLAEEVLRKVNALNNVLARLRALITVKGHVLVEYWLDDVRNGAVTTVLDNCEAELTSPRCMDVLDALIATCHEE